jgi:hypothetical protein
MNDAPTIPKARLWYGILFLVSLLVPIVHFRYVDAQLETTRYSWGLMPAHFLFLRWFGQTSVTASVVLLALFAASWRFARLRSPAVVLVVSAGLFVFASLYAAYGSLLVGGLLRSRCRAAAQFNTVQPTPLTRRG